MEVRRRLALALFVLNVRDTSEPLLLPALSDSDRSACWLRFLVRWPAEPPPADRAVLEAGLRTLHRDMVVANIDYRGPYLSAATIGVAFLFGPETGERYLVRHLICEFVRYTFITVRWPNISYFRDIGVPSYDEKRSRRPVRPGPDIQTGATRQQVVVDALKRAFAVREFFEPTLTTALMQSCAMRASAPLHIRPTLVLRSRQMADAYRDMALAGHKLGSIPPECWAEPAELVAEQLQDSFGLKPSPHWAEAFQTLLMAAGYFQNTKLDGRRVKALLDGAPLEGMEDLAGCLLMVDADAWLLRRYRTPAESPFKALAVRARDAESAVLRLVVCLRDLCFGLTSRTDDLLRMALSPDNDMSVLLNECILFPPDPRIPAVAVLNEIRAERAVRAANGRRCSTISRSARTRFSGD